MPDYSRLVLVEKDENGTTYYYPYVGPEKGLCENCYFDKDENGEQMVWTPLVYDDAELTVLQRQTGGNVSFCGDCISDQILGVYDETPEYRDYRGVWFVRPAGPLPTPARVYGGC